MSFNLTGTAFGREFEFTSDDFNFLREVVTGRTGIVVADEKEDMFYSRLARKVRKLGLTSFRQYCELIRNDRSGVETARLVNAITTNLTSFFRENHHFEYLSGTVLPELENSGVGSRRLRIWSAGCSTGEEPYSIAVTLCEAGLQTKGWDIQVKATDVNSEVLAQAAEGVYSLERLEGLGSQRLQRWFLKGKGAQDGKMRVKPEVSRMMNFAELNLVSPWSLPEPVDIIFCRNVIIYFDRESKKKLIDRMADNLKDGGYLFIGHSE
ncbi:MAG: protein-glutamate O-methyltransferase CheR, partial [Gammaproteobacteria bacterium]|nr:protein-glutamate O-methyltransferase CheR [Gammaproteobacteria bacterium]